MWLVESESQRAEIGADPLYSRLDVATAGRDVYLTDGSGVGAATTFQTVLSVPFLLDGLVPRPAAAVDGDPRTAVAP